MSRSAALGWNPSSTISLNSMESFFNPTLDSELKWPVYMSGLKGLPTIINHRLQRAGRCLWVIYLLETITVAEPFPDPESLQRRGLAADHRLPQWQGQDQEPALQVPFHDRVLPTPCPPKHA